MLQHARFCRKREVASRAIGNGINDFGTPFAGRGDDNGHIRYQCHDPLQPSEIFHPRHQRIKQDKIEVW
ncbi:MAG TPA: hypothetical protein VKF35_20915 [Hyphomicrobiaceae bacterium]|nr:hypothetical protein [Hyphomicrobiaceae bacterium]